MSEKLVGVGTTVGYDSLKQHAYYTHAENRRAQFVLGLLTSTEVLSNVLSLDYKDVVSRFCDLTDALYDEFHARGWMAELSIPSEEQIAKLLKA